MTVNVKDLLKKLIVDNNEAFIKYVYDEAKCENECEYVCQDQHTYNEDFRFGGEEEWLPKVGDTVIPCIEIQDCRHGNSVTEYEVIEHKPTGLNFAFRVWYEDLQVNTEDTASWNVSNIEFLGIVEPTITAMHGFKFIETPNSLLEQIQDKE